MDSQADDEGTASKQQPLLRKVEATQEKDIKVHAAKQASSKKKSFEVIEVEDSDQSTSTTAGEIAQWWFFACKYFLKKFPNPFLFVCRHGFKEAPPSNICQSKSPNRGGQGVSPSNQQDER